jgi:hypothetical protein
MANSQLPNMVGNTRFLNGLDLSTLEFRLQWTYLSAAIPIDRDSVSENKEN